MTTSSAAKRETDFKAILQKDIATKNPIFSSEHLEELFNLFTLYSDPRTKKTDIRDVLVTARALGLDKKYELVFRAMEEISETHGGDRIDFETYIRELTRIIVSVLRLRATPSPERAGTPPSTCSTPRARACWRWRT